MQLKIEEMKRNKIDQIKSNDKNDKIIAEIHKITFPYIFSLAAATASKISINKIMK